MLVGLMARTHTVRGLLLALLAVPLVAGCTQLIAPAGGALDVQPALGPDGAVSPAPLASPSFFSSNDGYALALPAGWLSLKANSTVSGDALGDLALADPALGAEADSLLGATNARMSMLAVETTEIGLVPVPPGLAILVMPTAGASDAETQKRFSAVVNGLTNVDGAIDHSVISVAAGDAHRYDLSIQGDALSVQLRLYLFMIGDDGILLLGGRDAALADANWPDMDAIVKSLRFGV